MAAGGIDQLYDAELKSCWYTGIGWSHRNIRAKMRTLLFSVLFFEATHFHFDFK